MIYEPLRLTGVVRANDVLVTGTGELTVPGLGSSPTGVTFGRHVMVPPLLTLPKF